MAMGRRARCDRVVARRRTWLQLAIRWKHWPNRAVDAALSSLAGDAPEDRRTSARLTVRVISEYSLVVAGLSATCHRRTSARRRPRGRLGVGSCTAGRI